MQREGQGTSGVPCEQLVSPTPNERETMDCEGALVHTGQKDGN